MAFGGNQLKICDDNVMLRNELCDPGKRFDGGVIFGGDGGEGDFTHDASFLPLSVELMAGRLVFDDLLLHRRGH